MRSAQRPAISFHTCLAATMILVTLTSGAPAAQRIASEFGAAGAPYADPAYCSALPALVTKFEGTVLPKQARDLADQKWRLSEAEAGRAEAAEEFNKALRDGITTLATDQLATAKALRARVTAMKSSGMSQAARREWLESIKKIEDAGKTIKEGMGRADFVDALRQNQTDLVTFMKFVEDSGAADAALKGLADTLAPGVGGLVVSGIKVGLDVVYAGLKGRFTAQEAAQWRDNVDKLRLAHEDLKDKVDGYRQDLTGGVCGPKVAQQVQNSPKPIAPTAAARPTPAPATISPPTSSGPSIGKILGWTTVLVGGVVGGAYVYEQAQLLAEETGSTNTNTTTTTTTNNPTPTSNTPSTVGLGGFSCTAANATSNFRTCTGSINVRAGTALGARAGSSIGVQTTPSFFVGTMTAPSVGGTTGTVSLRATLASCPTQTSVNFAPVGGQPFESVSVSIPVSCP